MNIIQSDVGRPIGHLKPNFRCPDLEALIGQVIRTGNDYAGEVETQEGRLLAMQIRAYKVANNQIDGAVLALIDISTVRQQETAHLYNDDTEDAFLALAKEPIVMLDGTFAIRKANRAFGERFGQSPAELRGRSLFQVGEAALDGREVHELLETVLPGTAGWAEVTLESGGARFGGRPVRVRARSLANGGPRPTATLLLFEDVTRSPPDVAPPDAE
jgi:two-component system CheB/CheR fusion protein